VARDQDMIGTSCLQISVVPDSGSRSLIRIEGASPALRG
jgi:hypothetical protein